MKFVFLDVKTIGDDIDLSRFDLFGEVVKYPFSTQQEVPERIQDADVIIVNKIQVNEASIGAARNLKLVCVTATGTNNLDKEYLDKRGIAWRNVAGYSTESVAQHTFAMLFYLLELCDITMTMSKRTTTQMTLFSLILPRPSTN